MRTIVCTLAILASGVVSAGTMELTQPALAGIGIEGRTACVGDTFNANDSITGACHTIVSSPCSGRGCQPVTFTTNYIAAWDAQGNATGVEACSVLRHHLPQPNTTTYLNGHNALDCPGVVFNQGAGIVEVDGIPYYYVTTSVDGNELINSNVAGYLLIL